MARSVDPNAFGRKSNLSLNRYKFFVAPLIVISLLMGIFSGWYRLGFALPLGSVIIHHGAIMTGSFLGSVIILERIVAFKKPWLYLIPVVNGSSIVWYLLGWNTLAHCCLVAGSVGLVYVFYRINRIYADLAHLIMWGASACWLVGNIFLLSYKAYAYSIMWWIAFLMITIAAERLELNRFLPVSKAKKYMLVYLMALFVIACIVPFHTAGRMMAGLSMMLIALWLLQYDMIWKAIKMPGIHRYSAVLLLMGYCWLWVSGLLFLFEKTGYVHYDALLHTFFIGFVFSMILAHAPIILPGVLGLSQRPYHPSLYVWGVLLQITLLVRVMGGMLSMSQLKYFGGLANGIVILLFLVNLAVVVRWKLGRG